MDEKNLVSTTTMSGFQFGHVPITDAFDNEQMIGMIALDTSGSVGSFASDIERMLIDITKMNKKLPTKNKIMQRVTRFSDYVTEVHGLQPVDQIDENNYVGTIKCRGMTALRDAILDTLEASETFCRQLIDQDYDATACIFIVTDGEENNSVKCKKNSILKAKIDALKKDEKAYTSAPIIVMIGVNMQDINTKTNLEIFAKECGIDKFISVEDASPSSLGKIAGLISQSFSSKSQTVTSQNTQQVLSQVTI
ncbi:MAG: hypothetical protein M0R17_05050 [Candidatus Omnitrophica bacterium]|jgi:hypothetical protein|nr:hypothetical protein [Candidatus Omnitrophota bacterium]